MTDDEIAAQIRDKVDELNSLVGEANARGLSVDMQKTYFGGVSQFESAQFIPRVWKRLL